MRARCKKCGAFIGKPKHICKKAWNKGMSMSEKTKQKLSIIRKGRPALNKGIPHTIQTKDKIRQKALGNKRWLGKFHSDKSKHKISLANKGERHSIATEFKKGRVSQYKNKERLAMQGEKNPNWQGGKTALAEKIRRSIKYRKWQRICAKRYKYICQLCFKKINPNKTSMHIDHFPSSFAQILKSFQIITFDKALTCKKLWDINNGRPVHKECHKKTATYLKPLKLHPILNNVILE